MRILGYVDHPVYKITVFKMDNRIVLKLENERYEQVYKLGDDERLSTLQQVKTLVDNSFLQHATQVFQLMHQNRMSRLAQMAGENAGEPDFPVIV